MLVGAAKCLDDDTILTFVQGLADDITSNSVRIHLDRCDDCRSLVAEAGRAIYDDASGLTTLADRPPSGEHLRAGSAIDRYVILGVIGQGGMGVVYAAFDPQLRRRVAVKLLRADSHGADVHGDVRLLREAQAMAQLSHPNVVHVYDAGIAGNNVFVAMELVEGVTLTRWLKDEARGTDQILDAFAGAGLGLAAAHAAGIVHRDFKTANVLLAPDGRGRVTDFGLARPVAERADEQPAIAMRTPSRAGHSSQAMFAPMTETGAVIGTPAYMAPEQFKGEPADARADQFSFCVALYEALYGLHPFADALDTDSPSLLGVLPQRPPPSDAPAGVFAVLRRGLARDPAARFASMDDLLQSLAAARRIAPHRRILRPALFAVLGVALAALAALLSLSG